MQFKFHSVTGKNITLLEDGLYARRKRYIYGNAVVYGSAPIKHRGTFEVEIKEFDSEWVYSIRIGVMMLPTGTQLKETDVPKNPRGTQNYCMWCEGELWNGLRGTRVCGSKYGSVNLDDLRKGDKVGMRLSCDGTLSFFINGRMQGVAVKDLKKVGYDYYPVIDFGGKCNAVRITRAG